MGSVLIGLKLMMKMTRLSVPGKDQGEGQQGRRHGGSLLETTPPVQADDAFYKQLAEASQLPAFVLSLCTSTCQMSAGNTAERKQPRRFLECVEDIFLTNTTGR